MTRAAVAAGEPYGGHIRFLILGPVEAWRGEERLPLAGVKQRALLAGLALRANKSVSTDQLTAWLWGEDPPVTATQQLHKQISQLRAVLGPGSIERHAQGYLLRTEPDQVDAISVETTVEAGRALVAEGRPREAADRFRDALRTWRGRSLGDVTPGLGGEGQFLEERRLATAIEWADAQLAVGDSTELVAELQLLVVEHAYQERLWARLILALYRAGRVADALASYEQCRTILAEGLGLDPGAELRTLHQAILEGDPCLDVASPGHEGESGQATPPPTNLPAAIGDFTGREAQLGWVRERLADGLGERLAVPVIVISGKGGVGKTSLALQVAHGMEAEFPDGRLYANLRGYDPQPADPYDVLRRLLRALGVDGGAIPQDHEELGDLFRARTAGRRMLFLLDNVMSDAQARPLLPGSPTCCVLVTSRARLPGLDGAQSLNLEVFEPEQALRLIESIVGKDRVAAESGAAHQIAELCGHLPLAVRIAAARLAGRPHWPLSRLVDRLAYERRRLDELTFGDLEVRASVALGYNGLSDLQRRAFRRFGLLQVPEFGAWVLGPLLGIPVDEAEDLVETLIDSQLLEVSRVDRRGQVRLRFHDLILLFARECLAEDAPQVRRDALVRVSDAWSQLAGVAHASAFVGASRAWGPAYLADGTAISKGLSDFEVRTITSDPLNWYDDERMALRAAVLQACEAGLTTAAWSICHYLVEFLELRGQYDDWEKVHRRTLRLCIDAGDAMGEATTRLGLAQCVVRYDIPAALAEADLALAAFRGLACLAAEAEALVFRASTVRDLGRHQDALDALEQARIVAEDAGNDLATVRADREIALTEYEQGRETESVTAMRRSLERAARSGMPLEQAASLRHLAIIKREHGDHAEAIDLAEQALVLYRTRGDLQSEAFTLLTLGLSALSLGKDGAASLIRSGLDLLTRLGIDFGDAETHYVMARLDLAEGRVAQAIGHLNSARSQEPSPTSRYFGAQVNWWLGEALRESGRDREALARYREARDIYREIGNQGAADGVDELMAPLVLVVEQ